MKRFYTEFESDKVVCHSNTHIAGFASSIKTAKGYIGKTRKMDTQYNPRNFRIYDTLGELNESGHVPCVYKES